MPRYLVQRTFKDGLVIPVSDEGAATCRVVVDNNAGLNVTWVHSYVSQDKSVSYCIYDGPSPEPIRKAAEVNRYSSRPDAISPPLSEKCIHWDGTEI